MRLIGIIKIVHSKESTHDIYVWALWTYVASILQCFGDVGKVSLIFVQVG